MIYFANGSQLILRLGREVLNRSRQDSLGKWCSIDVGTVTPPNLDVGRDPLQFLEVKKGSSQHNCKFKERGKSRSQ